MYIYQKMIQEVLRYGTRKENRTGVDTLSTFNFNYELCWDPAMYPLSNPTRLTRLGPQPGDNSYTPTDDTRYVIDGPGKEGYALPLLTTKDVSWKNIVAEMLWFLSGEPNIRILQDHGCKFWDAWADKDGNVPSAYGNFWRRFPVIGEPDAYENHYYPAHNDQIAWALNELRKNPMSRRVIVSAWAPGNAQTSKLPPCHMVFTFNVQNVPCRACDGNGWVSKHGFSGAERDACPQGCQGKPEQRLCLHLTQRSCDLALGVPYNMASYGLLLLIFSHLTGIKPGIFAHTLLDLHIYCDKPDGSMAEYNHVPGLKDQLSRTPRELPRLTIDPSIKELADIEALMKPGVATSTILEKFALTGYSPHPAIKFKVAV